VRRRVLRWYVKHQRDLPWRRSRDAYAIWVSEIMLQQTRVDTVRDRYVSFLKRFPTLSDLAEASEQDVLREWEGLGYYRRARLMRKAARSRVEAGFATLPESYEALLALSWFGVYTAAAVASIAFGKPHAVVDGNVIRVLTRWRGDAGDVTRSTTKARITETADRLLAPRRAGDFNQAIMEIGALLCAPRSPRCSACPLARECVGRAEGHPEAYPVKPSRKAVPHYDIAAGLVWDAGRVLIGRRPAEGLLGGLWEFPGGKRVAGESLEETCVREIAEETGLRVRPRGKLAQIDHAYSHFKITLHLFHCERLGGTLRARGTEDLRFASREELADYPFPRANRRALETLEAEGPPAWAWD